MLYLFAWKFRKVKFFLQHLTNCRVSRHRYLFYTLFLVRNMVEKELLTSRTFYCCVNIFYWNFNKFLKFKKFDHDWTITSFCNGKLFLIYAEFYASICMRAREIQFNDRSVQESSDYAERDLLWFHGNSNSSFLCRFPSHAYFM